MVTQSCRSKKHTPDDDRLSVLVKDYLRQHGKSYEEEDRWWGDRSLTWEDAIKRAWRSRQEDGKMHGHQHRVAHKLSAGLAIALTEQVNPEDFQDFQSLYDWVKSIAGRVSGLGLVTTYDVARRLGALGDYRSVGEGVFEFRIDCGAWLPTIFCTS